MFGSNHYVPILRLKQAERIALRDLEPSDRERITPLIELTPASFKDRKQGELRLKADEANVLDREAKRLLEACQYSPFFLDLRRVDRRIPGSQGEVSALEYLAARAREYRLLAVPVTGLNTNAEYQSSVSRVANQDGRGVCVRIRPSEVLEPAFGQDIRDLLVKFGLEPESVHLVIDYETNDPIEPDPQSVLMKIPRLDAWKTLTVARGAFPPDLQDFQPGNWRIPRKDWLAWTRTVPESDGRIRKPSFSDYTIQYALYKEPPDFCNPSVSIRYTLENEWFIMRGEATRGKNPRETEVRPGHEQWNAQAQLLCENEELFYGSEFSRGDGFIPLQPRGARDVLQRPKSRDQRHIRMLLLAQEVG
jgi:hypothetical protein